MRGEVSEQLTIRFLCIPKFCYLWSKTKLIALIGKEWSTYNNTMYNNNARTLYNSSDTIVFNLEPRNLVKCPTALRCDAQSDLGQ